jgi:uncharacterized protein (DUF2336 family)
MSFLAKITGGGKGKKRLSIRKQQRDEKRYEQEREAARSKKSKDRLRLAKDPKTHLEILYYLAEDQDTKVRRAVAANPSTPVQVSEVLANDTDTDVKIALIERLTALLPDLSQDQYAHLYAFAAQALGILALDEVLKVRLALSSALRDELYAPPEVVSQLARDLEREVSEPILKLCTAVPDDVLIDILIQHPDDWVIEAIAGRQNIGDSVSDAVIETKSILGGKKLIENETAKLSDMAVESIIEQAKETPEWHKPLALQTHLPSRVIRDIISFVDQSIQKLIFKRADMDDLTRKDLMDTINRRVNFMIDKKGNRITPDQKVAQLHHSNDLNDDSVRDALALREYDVVYLALAKKSGLPAAIVKKMIQTQSAKAVTSLVWKADMDMRTALEIQKTMAKIQPRELIYPRHGDEFPLSKSDMEWQIGFFSED